MSFWQWLKSWFQPRGVGIDYYYPPERLIYSYFDGQKKRSVDPIPLYIKVMERGPEIAADWKVVRTPCGGSIEAHRRLVETLQGIFDVKPYAEGGLTGSEVIDLADHFLLWAERLKKNSGPSSRPATSTAPASPAPTPSSLPSGSNTNGTGSEPPASSPMASTSPSATSAPDLTTTMPSP